jgi:hypothetical protein
MPAPKPIMSEVLNLSMETWGVGGPETRRSRTASATFVPVLGYPDPNPFETFRLFGRWRK